MSDVAGPADVLPGVWPERTGLPASRGAPVTRRGDRVHRQQPPAGLFGPCPVAACLNLTDRAGEPCEECKALFGACLREIPGPELPEPDPAPAPPGKRYGIHVCWCCEERHPCVPDPDMPGRWICLSCRAA